MRTDWIDDIVALIDAGGIADAAVRRNVSQPAFSRRLQALEDVLGIPLVDRSVRPSGPSVVLKDHADMLRRFADDQRRLVAMMRQASHDGAPQLAIVCQHAITTSLGPRLVAALQKQHAHRIRLRSANHDECDAQLFSQNAAIAVMYQVAEEPAHPPSPLLEQIDLGSDALVPVVGSDHARRLMWDAHRGRLSIIGYPLDVFLGEVIARHIMPAFEKRFETQVVAETALTPAAFEMARAGTGIAWVPRALTAKSLEDGDLIDLTDELGSVSLRIVARRRVDRIGDQQASAWSALQTALSG